MKQKVIGHFKGERRGRGDRIVTGEEAWTRLDPSKKSPRGVFLSGDKRANLKKCWKMKPGEICLSSVEAESLKENVWRWVDKRKRWMDWPCRSRLSAVTSYCTALGSFVEPGRVGETKEYKGTRKPRR